MWLNTAPPPGPATGALADWPGAPPLAALHPRARRPRREAEKLVQLSHALLLARTDSGRTAPPPSDMDVLLGTALGSEEADADFVHGLAERGHGFGSPGDFVYTLPTAAPAEVAIALGLRGALATLDAGSISGLFAVARAVAHVAEGRARACISGGVELGRRARVEGSPPQAEVVALFLLEPAGTTPEAPRLCDAAVGFDAEGELPLRAGALDTLLALATACAVAARSGPVDVAGRSREGYWARLRVQGGLPA